jgi:glycosyltransferase involved in cell wall biosynthesis
LAETDVYFMPSVSEPFGLAALEAAQFDVPLVLSLQSGVSEVLPHVLTADYWDTETFANYIYTLLEYPALAKELTTLTKEDIKNATWDAAALKVIALYEKLVPKEDEFMFI